MFGDYPVLQGIWQYQGAKCACSPYEGKFAPLLDGWILLRAVIDDVCQQFQCVLGLDITKRFWGLSLLPLFIGFITDSKCKTFKMNLTQTSCALIKICKPLIAKAFSVVLQQTLVACLSSRNVRYKCFGEGQVRFCLLHEGSQRLFKNKKKHFYFW